MNEKFLKLLDDAVNTEVDRDTPDIWSLGMITQALKSFDPSMPLVLEADTSMTLALPHSYRGYYHMLAFRPQEGERTVVDWLRDCEIADGSVFEGYKGGNFPMGIHTKCWLSPYGTATGLGIVGVEARTIMREEEQADVVVVQVKRFE